MIFSQYRSSLPPTTPNPQPSFARGGEKGRAGSVLDAVLEAVAAGVGVVRDLHLLLDVLHVVLPRHRHLHAQSPNGCRCQKLPLPRMGSGG